MLSRLASVAALLMTSMSFVAGAEPAAERQETLIHRLKHDCGSCHGMTLKGGLGPPLSPVALADRSDDSLVDVILNGIPGTPMPPWRGELEAGEAAWLVARMKEGLTDDE